MPLSKLTEYLLSPTHPVGRHKARFFRALGFSPEAPLHLGEALKQQARAALEVQTETTPYGHKWVAEGALAGPAQSAVVRSVWIESGYKARLITVYPTGRGGEE
ncbi:DUF6883 domain-containing protein [Meiothermus granaticius]|uniref:DUF6883 domain-containing protein n=1 Tax=Meiothermus granaticius NBRC 107808 TaxID=1227551 RepID=A0A399F602_9DEIN|nr:DUF6883 domain-containing protein [Meiothermus granaticius]RIH91155.1 hypothetical protein Mgrana_02939 [Meiothermus granaticius NBRC 107808]GEM88355.1 hypothetical protein MGR01S_29800 [Meiothermus granaticius NBRC 107808]